MKLADRLALAAVAGPLLGGYISDNYSWPWIFLINLPIGLFAAALTWSIYKDRDTGGRKAKVDAVGREAVANALTERSLRVSSMFGGTFFDLTDPGST